MFIVGNPKTVLVIIHAPCIEDPYARAYQLWSPRRGAGVAVHARRDSQDTDRAPWTRLQGLRDGVSCLASFGVS